VRDHGEVPLKLVTGPANSAKAQVVLDAYRAALAREALLVVPRASDVEHYRRELAVAGAVFGVQLWRFDGLIAEIARRAGIPGEPLGEAARRRVCAVAAARVRLEVLAASASAPGFAAALAQWAAELEAHRVEPERLAQALRAWSEDQPDRRRFGRELGALYRSYRAELDRLRRADPELFARQALDAISAAPGAWRGTPLFLYGFDDLTPVELDVVETLSRVVGAPVVLSLPFEAGRRAFAGRAHIYAQLRELADEHVELPARADHYAPASVQTLHHLERALFEPEPDRVPASPALRLLEAGSPQAELDGVAAEVAGLVAGGVPSEQIAVLMRLAPEQAPLAADAFARRGVPLAREVHESFRDTALGRSFIALLRCALLQGSSDDLLAWLRMPGLLEVPELADRLERVLRREGVETADGARAVWERDRWPLEAVDRLRRAQGRGRLELMRQLARELEGLFAAPRRRRAPVLEPLEEPDAGALVAGRRLLEELSDLARTDPEMAPDEAELCALLAELPVRVSHATGRGVLLADPLSLRARRIRALFVCGLAAGGFPAAAPAHSFLSDEERVDLARSSGLALLEPAARPDIERFLLYAILSRAEELLVLSWHTADDEGVPRLRSLYVDDVIDLFEPAPAVERIGARAPVAEAGSAPRPIGPLRSAQAVAELEGRPAWSASSLELWAGCPVRWFVQRYLNPEELDPADEALRRGGVAHSVLEQTLLELGRRTGSAKLTSSALPLARELLAEILPVHAQRRPLSSDPLRRRVAVRRLRADLERYLEQASSSATTFEPRHLELEFGMHDPDAEPALDGEAPDGEHYPALELDDGGQLPLRLRGRIDRVDVDADGRRAIVYDYKGRNVAGARRWAGERVLQMPLYMLAVRRLLGLDVAGGFYQPLAGGDLKPRGALAADADPELAVVGGDRVRSEELDELIEDAVTRARAAVAQARAGGLEPRPGTCSPGGGCSYPVLCRCEGL